MCVIKVKDNKSVYHIGQKQEGMKNIEVNIQLCMCIIKTEIWSDVYKEVIINVAN